MLFFHSKHEIILNSSFFILNSFVPLHPKYRKPLTNMLLDRIEELLKEVSEATASNAEEIEQLRLKYLSKKGEINALMNDFRTVAAEQKKELGMRINLLKQTAIERINALREQTENAAPPTPLS